MRKKDKRFIITIIFLIIAIITLWINYVHPKFIEQPKVNIITAPYGIFDSGSQLALEVRNIGKPNFNFCIKLFSNNKNIDFTRDYDCHEFFGKGEEYFTRLFIDEDDLFNLNPKNFTLTYSSNSNWNYECFLEKTANNFYKVIKCEYQ